MLEWEEGDRFSFEDSDRFEEDSLCSWSSEPESLCNNWRGWKKPAAGAGTFWGGGRRPADGELPPNVFVLCVTALALCSTNSAVFRQQKMSNVKIRTSTCYT
jgi:hypothetical protein